MQVTPEQSLALVEYIAHLSVSDWNGIARDLRALGFVPPGDLSLQMQSSLVILGCDKLNSKTMLALHLQSLH